MRDFKQEIDQCHDNTRLIQILDELSAEIDLLEGQGYEDAPHQQRIHDLELLLRYGEHKLTQLLS